MGTDLHILNSRSVHRALAWRLGLAALVLSLVVGGFAWLSIRDRFTELVSAVARVGAARINAQFLPLLDDPARLSPASAQAELDRLTESRAARIEQGDFVAIRLSDRSGRLLASSGDRSDPLLDQLNARLAVPPQATLARPEFFRLSGRAFVLIAQPLTDSSGRPVMEVAGVFAASPEALAAYRWQLTRTVLFTLGVVLATALLLYPLIRMLLDRVLGLSRSLLLANLDTIRTLGSAIAKRDSDTDDHNYRVSLYCIALGEALALPAGEVVGLIKGAFLHDVGKIGIHDRILLKPGRLDADEFMEMQKHVDYGLDIVRRCRWLHDAVGVVGGHHEKFDGSGYPAGLQGEAIPLNARIFAVTDVFDALASRRPYKEPLPLSRCLEILAEGRGGHFDPAVVDVFAGLAPELHARYGACAAAQLREAMQEVLGRYFTPGDLPA